jgi:hypothetical protein
MRKNTVIWRRWSPVDGNGLHNLQLRILLRAMELLKPGGRLVYSTCSFNPIENEAVVSAALNKNRAFEIVDVAADLPILNRRPGMTSWKAAFDKDTKVCDTYADFLASTEVKDEIKDKITASLWPAGNEKELGIEKWCVSVDGRRSTVVGRLTRPLPEQHAILPARPGHGRLLCHRARKEGRLAARGRQAGRDRWRFGHRC